MKSNFRCHFVSFLKATLLATALFAWSSCASDSGASVQISDKPTVEITYLLSNFEYSNDPAHQVMEKSAGYFYTFDDPKSDQDEIVPLEKNGEALTMGFTKSNSGKSAFKFYGNETSMRIRGTTAGNGVGLGTYFEDGEELIPAVIDTEGTFDRYCANHPVLNVPCAEAVKEKMPRKFSERGQEGLVFWAKGEGTLKVTLNMPGVVDESLGGTCKEDKGEKCFDFHHVTVTLDGKWREYSVPFEAFKQGGWGKAVTFSMDEFTAVQFTVDLAKGSAPYKFDVWLDMIGFYGGEPWPFMENYPGAVDPVNGPVASDDADTDD